MIRTNHGTATVFSLNVNNRQYWITAKHVINGSEHLPAGRITRTQILASILSPGLPGATWFTVPFTVIDPGKDVDIAVLVPPHVLLPNPNPMKSSVGGIDIGSGCSFLGYPFGRAWIANFRADGFIRFPFVKHCYVSGQGRFRDSAVWYLDGMNNPGFSGGPVLIGNGTQQRVFAVVSGYQTEPVDVVPAPQNPSDRSKPPTQNPNGLSGHVPEIVNENSGFIVAFSINYALDAIREHPIGPTMTEK